VSLFCSGSEIIRSGLLDRFEAGGEVAQERGFFHNPHAPDLIPTVVNLKHSLHDVIDVTLRVDPPGMARRTNSMARGSPRRFGSLRANMTDPISTLRIPPSR